MADEYQEIIIKRRRLVKFFIMRNDTTGIKITFRDRATLEPVDKSDSEFTFTVKSAEDGSVIETLSTTGGDIVVSGTGNGTITIKGLHQIPYSALPVFDLQEEDADGEITTRLKGVLDIEKDITTA